MIWLSITQLNEIGVSNGILHRNRRNWKFRPTGKRGRNGKPIDEVLLESLPERFQTAYLRDVGSEFRVSSSELGENHPVDEASTPLLGKEGSLARSLTTESDTPADNRAARGAEEAVVLGADDGERRLTEALLRYDVKVREAFLQEAARLADIVERYASVNPKRTKVGGKYEYVSEVLALCDETECIDQTILAVEPSRSKPKSPHTLEAWAKQYKVDGLATFLRKPPERKSEVDNRFADISAGALQWFNDNWRKKPSAVVCHRDWKKEARKHGWTIPARGWVWRAYNDLPEVVKTIAFKGQKAYTGKYAPYVPRDYRDLDALQILVGDHSVRDVTVMLPDGSLTRPWLTLWQDLRTGLIWGSHLDLSPSSVTIGLAYADGVRNYGAQPLSCPDRDYYSYLYTDQGKDYRSKTIAGDTLIFKNAAKIDGGLNALCTQRRVGLMDELGVKHLMARGYNAREKMVERTHKDISAWEQNTFENEYCGRGIGHKPERWQKSWQRHQKLLTKYGMNLDWMLSESPFMTLEDYRDAISGWILEYNTSEHTRVVLGGATVVPIAEYERLYTTRFEISEDALALLLMKADRRTIGKNGIQFFQSHWHFLHEAMSEFKGQEIEIRYSDGDWERIWAVLPNGQVVEAEAVGNSGVLNKNKKTMGIVAKQKAHEQKMAREFQFVQQSNWRGETVEDRVAAQLGHCTEDPQPEQKKMAVNAPVIRQISRFDKPRLAGRPTVTAEMVSNANVIEGMFGPAADKPKFKEEWED